MSELSTKYDPLLSEEKTYQGWVENGSFHADEKSGKKKYSIVIPPPNVTGILHMGHALNNTIQDILVRWKRMQGHEALWMPGTDHAGIATQNVVERQLAKEGLTRDELGREAFIERVWTWKEEYGSTIIRQLKRLGCSCDWDRTRFTMDEGLSRAVKEVFLRLYEDGLLYKGDYIINWCPRCETALSDEEAEHRDVEGKLYYIKYPVKGHEKLEKENEDYVVVATTRPETMLGDVAVAINPKDEARAHLKDKMLILPLVGREIKMIFDENVDPTFGTGALKVTPAHDPVDFELGTKHGLPRINVMDANGKINSLGGDYEGMDRFECRETIIEDLKQRHLFIKSEDHRHAVGHCYRCHTVVEPRLSKQWFVKMKPLAGPAIEAVKDDKIRFYPERWTKVYLNWMDNIRDWCISRQIWWGHRIPVWYCKGCLKFDNVLDVEVDKPHTPGIFVGDVPDKCPHCGSVDIEQDPDVLDTWFSSWLWPFSTMGWPDETEVLKKFYPTDALVTAQEIIFFWVARMIMAGIKFRGDVPFKDVYIHGTVRDATGTKMSKSLGNVIDPLDVVREVGSDALRYSIISITSQGQDVFLSRDKFEIGRNFANKLWNASRYVLMSTEGQDISGRIDRDKLTLADKWILSNLNRTIDKVQKSLEAYRFNDAAMELYDFIWHKYCDWYLEISKLASNRLNTCEILVHVLAVSLKLLHPIMPFITEEIWDKVPTCKGSVMIAAWPVSDNGFDDEDSEVSMAVIIDIITRVRNIRAFWNIPQTTQIEVFLNVPSGDKIAAIKDNLPYIERLSRSTVAAIGGQIDRPERSVAALVGNINVYVPLGEAVDIDREKERIDKKVSELEKYLNGITKKLGNRSFLENAPEDVVNKEKDKQERFRHQIEDLKENISALL
ncbi:MAG: valine--tRNA ligase [Candidatus Omnitrophica bacterium]|nr:valine--tRNA ligase [Candidatus Omnitrophota bacterium]MDD5487445.1 valine--tRNA ligase [Candidatus Omnitrophota bacterium]